MVMFSILTSDFIANMKLLKSESVLRKIEFEIEIEPAMVFILPLRSLIVSMKKHSLICKVLFIGFKFE